MNPQNALFPPKRWCGMEGKMDRRMQPIPCIFGTQSSSIPDGETRSQGGGNLSED